jgi:hypothetical protein
MAGHTPAGFPFGVTWEEMEGLDDCGVPFPEGDLRKGGFEAPPTKRGR